MATKTCRNGHPRTPENSYLSKSNGNTICRVCRRAKDRRRYEKDSSKVLAKNAKWRDEKQWQQNNKDKVRAYRLKSNFGLTLEEYDDMLEAQGGVCKICKDPCSSGRNLAVDHDHATGAVRGLLCTTCNTGLGSFKDNPDLIDAAASYLRQT